MSETQTETYIFELEQAVEKLLYFFEANENGGYTVLSEGIDESDDTTEDLTSAIEFAKKTLYGYDEID